MGHMSMGRMGHVGHFGPIGRRHAFGNRFNGHHHRHNRFFFVGVPYFNDYYYDDYSDNCWWSRHYHRWVCSYY